MLKAADLRRIQRCREQGFSKGRTAEMLGFSRVTVRKYWSAVDCVVAPRKSAPRSVLAPHRELVYALFRQYRSCPRLAEVLREEHGIEVGLRAVQKFVEPLRETLRREDELYLQKRAERELAAANATIRAKSSGRSPRPSTKSPRAGRAAARWWGPACAGATRTIDHRRKAASLRGRLIPRKKKGRFDCRPLPFPVVSDSSGRSGKSGKSPRPEAFSLRPSRS